MLDLSLVLSLSVFGGFAHADAGAPLTSQPAIIVPGAAARYDYMNVDNEKRRLLAAHTGAGSLAVIDLLTNTVIASVPVGKIQGVIVDAANDQYVTGISAQKKVVFIDRKTLKTTGEVVVAGPVDDLELDPKTGMVYADHDDGTDVWVIDAKEKKLVGGVTIPEAPEFVLYEPTTDRLYQNIKSNDTLQVIDPTTNKVEAVWQTTPAASPHGLAVDGAAGRVYSAGGKGKLVAFDIKTGKVIATVDIAPGTDQIAYDAQLKRIYCASRGFISVVQATDDGAKLLANVASPAGAHTIAVDPTTHSVWVCYSDAAKSYVQEFKIAP
jgi:DNA-binding beta-propeller fold protein YncE